MIAVMHLLLIIQGAVSLTAVVPLSRSPRSPSGLFQLPLAAAEWRWKGGW